MILKDKSAIVTGAGQGIGRAIAMELAREGAKVCVADLNPDTAKQVEAEIKDLGREAMSFQVDITSLEKVQEMAQKAIDTFGAVDILVNNVGWDKIELFIDSEPETWDRVININFKGPMHCFKAILPHMIERKYGKIVSIASDSGRVGSSGEAVYSGMKGGIISFSKTIAREVARYGINVNCISPGPTDTPFFAQVAADNPAIGEGLKKAIPFRRLAVPEDLAPAIAFLVSDGAGYITGQCLSVSGGLTMV
ncbi:MAG: glucose 1-dehydrogenase [Deltaproteobacteria bacterium]|nr:glucose 1-dehydrogenase [Deltaproteobacteria bacterium]